ITALILLEYLEEFNKEIDNVKKNIDNPLEKGEKLFKLIAFKEAENILENLSKEGKNVNREKVLFYLARCKESSGKTSEALRIFQEIIFDNPKSEYAKYSNRRMFVIANNNNDEKIENLIKKNALLADDFDFSEFIDVKNNFETNINKNAPRENKDKTDVEFIDDSIKKAQAKLDKIKISDDKNKKPSKKYVNQFVAKYDKTGKKIKESFYNEDGNLEYFEIYEYDQKNGLKRILHYDSDKTLLYYHSYKYNSKGEKTTIQTYDASGKILEFF
ncbi:MAG TPA: hypothetical protein PLO89_08415, partial [Spirochaetota bacterium]|nr:hypothetical protein [Spirochaetota bacterium]